MTNAIGGKLFPPGTEEMRLLIWSLPASLEQKQQALHDVIAILNQVSTGQLTFILNEIEEYKVPDNDKAVPLPDEEARINGLLSEIQDELKQKFGFGDQSQKPKSITKAIENAATKTDIWNALAAYYHSEGYEGEITEYVTAEISAFLAELS